MHRFAPEASASAAQVPAAPGETRPAAPSLQASMPRQHGNGRLAPIGLPGCAPSVREGGYSSHSPGIEARRHRYGDEEGGPLPPGMSVASPPTALPDPARSGRKE